MSSNYKGPTPQATPQDIQETQQALAPPQATGSIPDLIKIGSIPSNTAIEVETSVLEPVVFSQNFCRFVFQNKGILNSNSKIVIGLDDPGVNSFLPMGVGVYSLIERATLKCGTKTICEVDDFSQFMAYQSLFLSSEADIEREQWTKGRCIGMDYDYRNPTTPASSVNMSNTSASFVKQSIGRESDGYDGWTTNGVTGTASYDLKLYPHQQLRNAPVFQMALDELFPFLKTNQLPLFMMKEQVSLELQFTPQAPAGDTSRRLCVQSGVAVADNDCDINQNQTKVVADYLYYPQEMMIAYQNANKQMSFTYMDYRSMKRTLARTGANGGENFIQNLGGAGRIVNKAIFCVRDKTDNSDSLLNRYNGIPAEVNYIHEDQDTSSAGSVTTNLKYNDTFVYPIDVDNMARHFHNVVSSEGKVPFVSRAMYSSEVDAIGAVNTEGQTQAGNLAGKFFWQSIRLNKNERVNSRGLELYQKIVTLPAGTYEFMCWLELVKVANFNDGYMETFFA
tara:strand:+ start:443 stop:1963 length:1521 start_codon:yes stop_codon:yes gene_type:complete